MSSIDASHSNISSVISFSNGNFSFGLSWSCGYSDISVNYFSGVNVDSRLANSMCSNYLSLSIGSPSLVSSKSYTSFYFFEFS